MLRRTLANATPGTFLDLLYCTYVPGNQKDENRWGIEV